LIGRLTPELRIQVHVYHDPRCRREMLDQDIMMLQLAAALMDPNEFVINVLNKFALVGWSNRDRFYKTSFRPKSFRTKSFQLKI
jgi:hypothetical protein